MKLPLSVKTVCLLFLLIPAAWAQSLGTTNSLEGPAAGSDSVVLAATGAWTATANDAWLHLSASNQSGTGSTNVIFTFDANSGATRTGTLTIASQTLNVTQAGSTFVAVTNPITLVSYWLSWPSGVAVDGAGNVYSPEYFGSVIDEWIAASGGNIRLVSSGLSWPTGVAVDGAGNIYVADSGDNSIKEWVAASRTVITLVSSGLNNPWGVAVDNGGNVYIADSSNNAIKEWVAASKTVITLVSSGLDSPSGVAVDGSGNVYIADALNNAIKEWVAISNTVTTLVSSGLNNPSGVAVDGSGNVYIADSGNDAIKQWLAASSTVITLVSSGLNFPEGVAVDSSGNVYIADTKNDAIKELPRVFVDTTAITESAAAGGDVLSVVLPATANLTGPFTPASDSWWLTISGVTNSVVSFAFTANNFANRTAYITVLDQFIAVTQQAPPNFSSLGTTNRWEGPTSGSDSVVLAANGAWTATANDSWLHLNEANQSGSGSTNVIFTFDANTGATRTGTLTIAGQTLTVTQAGSTYVAVTNAITLVSSGLSWPSGVAVDGAGNVYIADTYNNEIKEWLAASNTVTTLVSSGLYRPNGVAVDGAGNVYIADTYNNAIKEWIAASNTVITLVSSGLAGPTGVAVDGWGNVYIADTYDYAIKEWSAANHNVFTLVSSGLNYPYSVAVDSLGNAYIADGAIEDWIAASNIVTTLVSSGLSSASGVAVDGSGNVYIADSGNSAIDEWIAASNTLITLVSSGLNSPARMTVDGSGNIYIADTGNSAIKELPRAFVDTTAKSEPASGGGDTLPVVLPATANLTGPFAPVSDSSWLTITDVTNGVVSFAFTANNDLNRTGQIMILGQNITVTQPGLPNYFSLGTTNLLEGPAAGSDSVTLAANSAWTATANNSWLHLSAANQSGTGSANVIFTLDANSSATRTGSLTIAGRIVTVTQAGSTYAAVTNATTLVSSGLSGPAGVVLDGVGNVYFANKGNSSVKKWLAASNTVTTLVSSGLNQPYGVALDGSGNVFIADTFDHAIKEWLAASNIVIPLVSSGLSAPFDVAVDRMGNIYIADTGNSALKEWTGVGNTFITRISSGLNQPRGVAVDSLGNVYIADSGNNAIKEWLAASNTVVTLVASNSITPLYQPYGVAVDGSGNVYIADTYNNAIKEWLVANNTVITLVSVGLNYPGYVAVDSSDNVYIADGGNNAIKVLPRAFVDSTAKVETAVAGSDALPVVLPATANLTGAFAPVSDSAWLTITGVTNGVVSFAFTVNGSANQPAHITLLGQKIAVVPPPYFVLGTTNRWEGPTAGSDSVVLAANGAWTATANDAWLHLSAANQSGTGSTNVVFTFDANPGATRTGTLTIAGQTLNVIQASPTFALATTNLLEGSTAGSDSVVLAANGAWTATTNTSWLHLSAANLSGTGSANVIFTFDTNPGATRMGTLTIAGQTLTITQAGSTYVATTNVITLVVSSGSDNPMGVAVDGAGNVYISSANNTIKEWIAASNTVATLVSSGLSTPFQVAMDGIGNLYIDDAFHSAIKKWTATNNTVTTLVSSGLSTPDGIAVDGAGNVYIADAGHNAIKEWVASSNTVITLVSSGLAVPGGLAVDAAGNVYITDLNHHAVKEWVAASNTVITLVSSGLQSSFSVAVDGCGNVFIADSSNNALKEWIAASNTVNTLASSGLSDPFGVAVDRLGNIFIADYRNNAIKELSRAFVDPTAKTEGAAAGSDALPVVLPATANLTGPFAPVSDSAWLTITGVTNGVVSFAFDNNYSTNRTAHITLLGQSIAVTQPAVLPPVLTSGAILGNGSFRFGFTNNQGVSFSVWTSPDMTLPFTNWTLLGTLTNDGSGQFQFTDPAATTNSQGYYRVTSP